MRATMRKLWAMAGALLGSLCLLPMDSQAMPSFARQTGMNCNSCHIGTDNIPMFTRTGRLFSMRGYTRPTIRERLRSEGDAVEDLPQYGGNYLSLNWTDFFAGRLISEFAQGGKNALGVKSDVTSRPLARFSMFYTGPITDWLGLWTELAYLGNNSVNSVTTGQQGPTGLNFYAYDEYRLSAGWDFGPGTFFSVSFGNEHPDTVAQWNFPINTADLWYNGQGGAGRSKDLAALSVHGLIKDQFWVQLAVVSGQDNVNWSNGSNQYASFGYNIFRKQTNDLWAVAEFYRGKDAPSIMTAVKDSFICPGTCPPGVTDSSLSITNQQGFTAATITGAPIEKGKDFNSWRLRLDWAVADLGPHSWYAGAALKNFKQNFESGAKVERTLWGVMTRYFYQRTYGFETYYRDNIKYEYTTPAGVVRDTHSQANYGLTLLWNPAMNVSVHLLFGFRGQNTVFTDQMNLYQCCATSYQLGTEYNF